MCLDRVFYRDGAGTEKALSPQVQGFLQSGGERKFTSEEQRLWEGLW